MSEVLEYVIQLRGASEAASEARDVAGAVGKVGSASSTAGRDATRGAEGFARFNSQMEKVTRVSRVSSSMKSVGESSVTMANEFGRSVSRMRADAAKPITVGVRQTGGTTPLRDSSGHFIPTGRTPGEGKKSSPLSGGLGMLGGGLLAFASFQGLKSAVENTKELVIASIALSKVTGMNVDSAAAWLSIAQAHGVANRTLTMSFKTLSTQVVAALGGTKNSVQAFKALGITSDELKAHSHSLNDMMGLVADRFNKLPGGVEKTKIAAQLFGRGAQALIPILSEGSKGMEEQRKAAAAYGITLGSNPLANMKKLEEASINLKLAQTGLSVQFSEHVAPALMKVAQFALGLFAAFQKLPKSTKLMIAGVLGVIVALKAFQAISLLIEATNPWMLLATVMAAAAILIITHWKQVKAFLMPMIKSLGTTFHSVFNGSMKQDLVSIGRSLTTFLGILNRVFGPVARVMIRGFATAISSSFQILGGVLKVIAGILTGHFGKAWQGVEQVMRGVARFIGGGLRQAFMVTLLPAIAAVKLAVQGIGAVLSAFWNQVLKPVADFVTGHFSPAFVALNALFGGTVGIVTGVIGVVSTLWGTLKDVVNWMAGAMSTISNFFSALNPLGGIPGLGGGGGGALGALGSVGNTLLNPAGAVGGAVLGAFGINMVHRKSLAPVAATTASGVSSPGWGGRDIVVQVAGKEIARVNRREVIRAMAAGA